MAIDRHYIFDKVNFFLKKENKFFTSSELHMTIGVDSFRRIGEELNYPKTNYSSIIASGEYQISTPSDFIKIDQNHELTVELSSTIYTLEPKTSKLIGRQNILDPTNAIPQNYYMETESLIGLYPPGNTSMIVVIPYVKYATALSSDTDTNELTENCYMAAVYWTVGECMLKDNDERFATYMQLYDREILRLKSKYGEMFEEDKDLMPDDRYL